MGWLDAGLEMTPFDLKRAADKDDAPRVFIIDEADRYGTELTSIAGELTRSHACPVVILTIRAGRGLDRFADRADALDVPFHEFLIPHLSDRDIAALIDTLDAHNRLGALKGKPRGERVAAFRESAGRQILVALLEATSGRRFEELLISELQELPDGARSLYAIVATATALRFGLSKDELLLAVGDASNATLGAIDALQRRFLVVVDRTGELKARHRVVGEVLLKHLAQDGILGDIVTGLAVAAATKVGVTTPKNHRHLRRLRSLINHDWLPQQIGVTSTRRLFEDLETLLTWHHHYWLQRGSFELDVDDEEVVH